MTGRPFPTATHTCLLAAKIISHLVCKWALQSMTFQKQECKCLVSNQYLCKLMKEQFGFVCSSFGLFGFVCQSNSVYQWAGNGGKTLNYMQLHAQATCQFESWKSYQGIIPQLQWERVMRKPVYVLQNKTLSASTKSVSYVKVHETHTPIQKSIVLYSKNDVFDILCFWDTGLQV